MRDFSLTPRSEETRDPRPVADPVQFTLAQIRTHFDESLASIQKQFDVAQTLNNDGKIEECRDIWRSQIVFLEGILDFYLHELSKYALYQMFLGRWEKSARYQNLQLKMQDVETALDAPESKTWCCGNYEGSAQPDRHKLFRCYEQCISGKKRGTVNKKRKGFCQSVV